MQIKKHKQSKKLRFYKKKYIYIYIKKRSMYNMINANQQDIHWKKYILFNVDQVDEHEKFKSQVFMWLCIVFPVRHQIINLIKVVLLSVKINVISNKT